MQNELSGKIVDFGEVLGHITQKLSADAGKKVPYVGVARQMGDYRLFRKRQLQSMKASFETGIRNNLIPAWLPATETKNIQICQASALGYCFQNMSAIEMEKMYVRAEDLQKIAESFTDTEMFSSLESATDHADKLSDEGLVLINFWAPHAADALRTGREDIMPRVVLLETVVNTLSANNPDTKKQFDDVFKNLHHQGEARPFVSQNAQTGVQFFADVQDILRTYQEMNPSQKEAVSAWLTPYLFSLARQKNFWPAVKNGELTEFNPKPLKKTDLFRYNPK